MIKQSWTLLFIFFFLTSSLFLKAQISINAADLAQLYTIGNTFSVSLDSISGSYDIGTLGGGNNWDFSNIEVEELDVQTVVGPEETPFAESFSEANVATIIDLEEGGVSGSLYNYYNLDATSFATYGFAATGEAEGVATSTVITYAPTQPVFEFPITYESEWSYTGKQINNISYGGNPLPATESDIQINNTVDAYGMISFPGGNAVPALRIRETREISSEIIPGFPITSRSESFAFVTQSGAVLSISAIEEDAPQEGIVEGELTFYTGSGISSVVDLEAEGFRLSIPNSHPISGSSIVKYSLPEPENVRISLFDMQGKEVKVMVKGMQAAGEHTFQLDATDLSFGAYFMSLMARNGVMTQKVIVQK